MFNFFFFFVYHTVLTSEKASGWEETAPLAATQFLELARSPPEGMPFTCKVISSEPYLLYLAHEPLKAIFLYLNDPRVGAL